MAVNDSFLGQGWAFPPTFTPRGADVAMVVGVEDVHQSLQILLATQPGERVMESSFGCDLSAMLFEEVDYGSVNRVKQLISNAILKFEPRVNLDSVDVSDAAAEQGKLVISIEYTIRSSNSRFNMVFPFYVDEARRAGGVIEMGDFILIDGDIANFIPMFGAAVVVVQPGTLKASGPATHNGKKLCVDGDESSVEVPGCMYLTPQYVIPGSGTLKISALAGDQVADHTNTGGTAVMLKGSQFTAKFEVQSPAQQPVPGSSPIPDASPSYSGNGMFITTNVKLQGT